MTFAYKPKTNKQTKTKTKTNKHTYKEQRSLVAKTNLLFELKIISF
jgi:hypothetical protein